MSQAILLQRQMYSGCFDNAGTKNVSIRIHIITRSLQDVCKMNAHRGIMSVSQSICLDVST